MWNMDGAFRGLDRSIGQAVEEEYLPADQIGF